VLPVRVADTPAKHAAIAVTHPKNLRGKSFAILAARDGRGAERYGRASKSAASFCPFEHVAKIAAHLCDRNK